MSYIAVGALERLAFRLLVIVVFARWWPGSSPGIATAALCALLALGCLVHAIAHHEALFGPKMTRWHEAAVLLIIASVVLFMS